MEFSGEQVQLKGYITMKTNPGVEENAKHIKVMYLVNDVPSLYNMIIGVTPLTN